MSATFTWSRGSASGGPGAGTLRVAGEVGLASCRQTEAVLHDASHHYRGPVAVDLSDVTSLDAAGLSVLLVLVARLGAADRPVVLQRPSSPVVRCLALLGVADAVPLAPAHDDADGRSPSVERLALGRARSFRAVEHLLHDGTTWGDPCAGPTSSRDTATVDPGPAASAVCL